MTSIMTSIKTILLLIIILLLFLVVYPSILIAIQDLPQLPQFNFKRYFDHVQISQYSELMIGFCFSIIFIILYVYLFARAKKLQFSVCASILSIVCNSIATFLTSDIPVMMTYFVRGGILALSVLVGLNFSERLFYTLADANVFQRPLPVLYPRRTIGFIFYLVVPLIAYPLVLMMVESLTSSTPILDLVTINSYVSSSKVELFSLQYIFVLLVFLCCYVAGLTWLFVDDNRWMFFSLNNTLYIFIMR